MKAIEDERRVQKAARDWETKFRNGATVIGRLSADVYWHEDLAVWAAFRPWATRAFRPGGFLNQFGYEPWSLKTNAIVQISPPTGGENLNLQGAFAIDDAGDRWVLHQGRLHPGRTRVDSALFARASGRQPTTVSFRSGRQADFFPVANIDAEPKVMQSQLADFVHTCKRVRTYVLQGPEQATADAHIEAKEDQLFPEPTGEFEISARDATRGKHRHGAAFKALVAALKILGASLSNGRVGRHGPDLYTLGQAPTLFEIKSSITSGDIQQGLGQLLMYEQLLDAPYRKVLVLPEGPLGPLEQLLGIFDVRLLRFHTDGDNALFNATEIAALVGEPSPIR